MVARAERRTVSRETAHGTGVESCNLGGSQNDDDSRASKVIASSSCGHSARSRVLKLDWSGL